MSLSISVWAIALLPLLLIPLSLFWGAPVIALLSELIGLLTRKPFPARVARQLSRCGLFGHGLTWILVLTAGALTVGPDTLHSPFVQTNQMVLLTALALPVAGTLLFVLYDLTWKQSRQKKAPHVIIGLIANLGIKYGYWGVLLGLLLLFRPIPLDSPAFIPPLASPLWPLVCLWLPQSVTLAAGLGLCYLLIRRNRDDWGRDYYRYAAPFLSRWFLVGAVLTLGMMVWMFLSLKGIFNLYLPQIFYAALASAACLALAMILAACIAGSENPMRLKVSMIGLAVLTMLHAGLAGVAIAETLNHYVEGWAVPTFMPLLLRMLPL